MKTFIEIQKEDVGKTVKVTLSEEEQIKRGLISPIVIGKVVNYIPYGLQEAKVMGDFGSYLNLTIAEADDLFFAGIHIPLSDIPKNLPVTSKFETAIKSHDLFQNWGGMVLVPRKETPIEFVTEQSTESIN